MFRSACPPSLASDPCCVFRRAAGRSSCCLSSRSPAAAGAPRTTARGRPTRARARPEGRRGRGGAAASASRSSRRRTRRAWAAATRSPTRPAWRSPSFPSRSADTRPAAVVLADRRDWRVAASAAQLSAAPVRAPVLLTDGASSPRRRARRSTGWRRRAPRPLDGAQAIKVGAAGAPGGLKTTDVRGRRLRGAGRGDRPAATQGRGRASKAVVVASADSPEYSMPAAAGRRSPATRCCGSTQNAIPPATRSGDPAAQPARHLRARAGAGGVRHGARAARRPRHGTRGSSGKDPVANAIAFARFSDGSFGWNVVDPGHGLVFASAEAAAGRRRRGSMLSTSGTYGPLLLVPDADDAAAGATGLPARHPARLREGPGARRLQPRLDHGRRERRSRPTSRRASIPSSRSSP